MFFSSSLSLGLLASAVAVNAAIWDIQVGDATGTLAFSPEAIAAAAGDQVVFHFHQKNHTATQSSFASPCGPVAGGFNSGFMPVPANQTDGFPTWAITVNDTKPIWVFCDQAANTANSHCGAGMVFAVNCGADGAPNSFTNFKASALAVGAQLKAEASASAAPSSTDNGYGGGYGGYGGGSPAATTTAASSSVTIPPAPEESVVTVTVTVESSTWTTVYSSYPGSPAATPASLAGNTHVVTVGNNGTLAFDPPFVMAQPRDTIVFEFHAKNHTATLSSFDAPCNANSANQIDSGFHPVDASLTTGFPTWSVTVNDTNPLWFYCRQHKPDGSSHCGAGMVFAVNPVQTSPRNFTAFQGLALVLNGTNATGSAVTPTSSSPSGSSPAPSTTNTSSGAGVVAVNAALGFASLFALSAALL